MTRVVFPTRVGFSSVMSNVLSRLSKTIVPLAGVCGTAARGFFFLLVASLGSQFLLLVRTFVGFIPVEVVVVAVVEYVVTGTAARVSGRTSFEGLGISLRLGSIEGFGNREGVAGNPAAGAPIVFPTLGIFE